MMINALLNLANNLDAKGYIEEASCVDAILNKVADEELEKELAEDTEEAPREDSSDIPIDFYKGFEEKHLDPRSSFSHFDGSSDELKRLISDNLDKGVESSSKPGTFEVSLPPDNFYSGVVTLKEGDVLSGKFKPHMGHRELRKTVTVQRDRKSPAKFVKAIVGLHDQFALVYTILASDVENEPMNTQTLMYNRFVQQNNLISPEEFVNKLEESFHYWKDKVMFVSNKESGNDK